MDTSQLGHCTTLPHARQETNVEYPRRFMNSIACRPVSRHSPSSETSRPEKMPLLPERNSSRMSTTSTAGSGRRMTRSGSSSRR